MIDLLRSIFSIRVELQTSRTEINKLRSERESIEEKLIQQQKDHERQMTRQRETTMKLERTVDKLNKQINEYKLQQQIMKDKYVELQRRVQTGEQGKSSKSNSLTSLHKKHHMLQSDRVSQIANHQRQRQTNNQGDNDDQDVIFF